ncbi:hypothetical protein [Streptomyces canus]|uniref:hypothetical protein n=1 Tax=Streptomyces canus TaxID=58343 RepID=UPI00225BC627|nr:hypothetical protein [Streptomyces canus]MCX4858384.1 hypothetical protein [Streptomyces canus]
MPDLPDLSPQAVDTFLRILAGDKLAPTTHGLQELCDLGLAVPHPYEADVYAAVEPRHTYAHMVGLAHQHLLSLTTYVGALPDFLLQLRNHYNAARATDSVELLTGKRLINTRIAEQQSAARHEIRAAQPGQRTAEDLTRSRTRDPQALIRGLELRTLYHSSVRRVANVGEWANEMSAAGGEIRTLNTPFPRIIMYDTQAAFIPVHNGDDESSEEAILVRDPLVCGFIGAVFDLFWESADPWYGGRGGNPDKSLKTTPTQRALLRQLCLGKNQKQAAKACGISASWANEQMSDLRKILDVETMNEVIYWWATSPDHDAKP